MYLHYRWQAQWMSVLMVALLLTPAVFAAESRLQTEAVKPQASQLRKIPGTACGYLPDDVTEIQLLTLTTDQLQQLAGLNPYVAVALLYAQQGNVVERSPFGSRSRFGASLTPDQATQSASVSTMICSASGSSTTRWIRFGATASKNLPSTEAGSDRTCTRAQGRRH